MEKQYEKYVAVMQKIADLDHTMALLQWDKEVMMPTKGGRFRAQQLGTVSGIRHELATSEELGELLEVLYHQKEALTPLQWKNVEDSRLDFLKFKKLPTTFVTRRTEAISNAYDTWIKARRANDYKVFEPALAEIVALSREEAALLEYEAHPYDALIAHYEKGTTVATLDVLFADVKAQLVRFVEKLNGGASISNDFLKRHFDKNKQWNVGMQLLRELGYDFEAGRQDISEHPFTVNFSAEDVRVTTRIDENDFSNMTWGTIHEAGHALYEQGLPSEQYGLPCGKYISLGIHESQSRLWENNVGRGVDFWKSRYANLQKTFPESLADVDLTAFYHGINKVEPSLIRTESDELFYHFHILIRYEIEKGLMDGTLEAAGLNEVWNEKYKAYLGVEVPDDNQGILQDIHWSHGSFGYFATYSLGSFYAAQFYQQAEKDLPNLAAEIAAGDTSDLLSWLRTNIHQHGRFYTAEELCVKITGEPLNFKYFMTYAANKYGKIYGV